MTRLSAYIHYCSAWPVYAAGGRISPQECSTCLQIEEGSTMPYSDNTCPQCGKGTQDTIETAESFQDGWFAGRFGRLSIVSVQDVSSRVMWDTQDTWHVRHSYLSLLKGNSVRQRGRVYSCSGLLYFICQQLRTRTPFCPTQYGDIFFQVIRDNSLYYIMQTFVKSKQGLIQNNVCKLLPNC